LVPEKLFGLQGMDACADPSISTPMSARSSSSADPSSLKEPSQEEELQRYWRNNSSTSPSHVLQTPRHALVALFGVCSVASFSFALVQQKPFDASLSVVLAVLCMYTYTLQSDRCRTKAMMFLEEKLVGVTVDSSNSHSRATGANAATSELDLTDCAYQLGVCIRTTGVAHKEGSTHNKVLMDALAKEYLRCTSALKYYQNAFGALPKDSSAQDESISVENESSRQDPLITTLKTLNLGVDLAALGASGESSSAAPTPRSPPGPPSPDPKRSRAVNNRDNNEADVSFAPQAVPSPRPVSEASTAGAPHSPKQQTEEPLFSPSVLNTTAEWRIDEVLPEKIEESIPPAPRKSFGLFGR